MISTKQLHYTHTAASAVIILIDYYTDSCEDK
jgi:hypothetical protein